MDTFSWDDVRVTFLLQVSMSMNCFMLTGTRKLLDFPFCRRPMNAALAAEPKSFCSEHVYFDFHRVGSTRSQREEHDLRCGDCDKINEIPDSSEDALN